MAGTLRTGAAVCALAAVLSLCIAPTVHVHESTTGPAIVHSHVEETLADHDGSIDHGDHHDVRMLDPVSVFERQFGMACPALTLRIELPAPDQQTISRAAPADAAVAHGPPIRAASLRAPPA